MFVPGIGLVALIGGQAAEKSTPSNPVETRAACQINNHHRENQNNQDIILYNLA